MRLFELLKELGLTCKGKEGRETKALLNKLMPGMKVLNKLTPDQEQILRDNLTTPTSEEEEVERSPVVSQTRRDPFIDEEDETVVLNKDPNSAYRWVAIPEGYGDKGRAGKQYGTRRGAQGYAPVNPQTDPEIAPHAMKTNYKEDSHVWMMNGKILMKCPAAQKANRDGRRRARSERIEARMDAQVAAAKEARDRGPRAASDSGMRVLISDFPGSENIQREPTGRTHYSIPKNVSVRKPQE